MTVQRLFSARDEIPATRAQASAVDALQFPAGFVPRLAVPAALVRQPLVRPVAHAPAKELAAHALLGLSFAVIEPDDGAYHARHPLEVPVGFPPPKAAVCS
jgi:hypothetical protein